MPDDLGVDDSGRQPQTGGQLGGQQMGISGGSGIFHSLIGTMLSGMVSRAAMGGKAALAQNQGTPYARSMAAGINAPEVKQQQQDEQTERQQRIALTQVQYLQAKHLLSQADEQTQKEAHDVARGWFDHLYQSGDAEIVGGTANNPADLASQLSKARQQFPNDLVMQAPTGFSTNDHPTYAIYHVKNNSIEDAVDFSLGGHKEEGVPPMSANVTAGTNAIDGTSQLVGDMHKGLIGSELSKLRPSDGLAAPQKTADELKRYLRSIGKPVPDNFDDIYSIGNGRQALSSLQAKSVRNGKEFILGRDYAEGYIRHFYPDFNPDKMAEIVETRKALDKAEDTFAEKNGENAGQAVETAQRIVNQAAKNKGSIPPELEQRARDLIPKAQTWDDRYQKNLKAQAASKADKADFAQQKVLFDQRQEEGVDQTGAKLTLDEADMSTPVDEWGTPIPLKKASYWKAGAMADQTVKTAQVLLSKLDSIESQLKAHPDYVGPIGGSVGELKAHFGLGDKEAQQLYDDVTTAQSGFTKVHTSRFSKEILQKATTMLNPKMNVGQAMGAIASMRETAGLYIKDDQKMSKAEYLQHQQEIRQRQLGKMATYLKAAGYQGGQLTQDIQQKAIALAAQDGQEF